ncbi:MAG: HAD family hydrolase [Lachnospiraceae bacterium]|nr:HAD family hydrolase [Lachnospiraceae bacterium]
MNNTDSLIFDLDGTLWDTTEVAAKIWQEIAGDYPQTNTKVDKAKLRSLYGLPLKDISHALFTDIPEKLAEEIVSRCVVEQCPYLEKHGAILMGDIEGVFKKLSEKYRLFIISNCEDGYIQSFLKAYDLSSLITDFDCPGMSGFLKADNIKRMVKKHGLKSPVYVGDTKGDMEAAKEAGVSFAFAAYGFGSASEYDYRLNEVADLLKLF